LEWLKNISSKLGTHHTANNLVRRIPKRCAHIDARTYSKAALNTDSLTVARERRDAMADADENLWDAAHSDLGNNPTPEVAKVCRYRSAQRRAQAIGVKLIIV